jgi:hypothetical protein
MVEMKLSCSFTAAANAATVAENNDAEVKPAGRQRNRQNKPSWQAADGSYYQNYK